MGIRKILILFSKSPYGDVSIVEGIRLATGVTAADLESMVLFIDDGVLAVSANQKPDAIGILPISSSLEYLTASGIQIRVLRESLNSHGIPETKLQQLENMKVISLTEMAGLIPQFDAIISI